MNSEFLNKNRCQTANSDLGVIASSCGSNRVLHFCSFLFKSCFCWYYEVFKNSVCIKKKVKGIQNIYNNNNNIF